VLLTVEEIWEDVEDVVREGLRLAAK